jgi:exopolysaccharide production protein ExoQ
MPPSVAALLFGCFALWLFAKDAKRAKHNSLALWLPVVWVFIIGSKPASLWLAMRADTGTTVFVEDTLLDKALFFFLVIAGMVVVMRRRINWRVTLSSNAWLFAFFFYLLVSVAWSDEPMSSFKRWFKDFGNVVMVLVILSERDPVSAVRTFFARCGYVFIPLSMLVVRYYPSISMQFTKWEGEALFVGISTNKNIFGMTMCSCALGLFWLWLDALQPDARKKDRTAVLRYSLLLLMTGWLVVRSGSSTALTCAVLGCGFMVAMKFAMFRKKMKYLGMWTAAVVMMVVFLQVMDLWGVLTARFAAAVGRDPTFHGRFEIWAVLLEQDINPVLGVGYYSFWTDERMKKLSEGYHYLLNEAHNGYLETYLNSGVIGLGILIAMLASAGLAIKRDVVKGVSFASLRFSFLLAAIFYGISEAVFNRLLMVWFVLLLAVMTPPRLRGRKQLQENVGEEAAAGETAV